ncbi:YfhO family protein, partial [Candidatus Omnitrophota bacterium]
RSPVLSYKRPPDWHGINGNQAYILRLPTQWSATPWVDMRTVNIMTQKDYYHKIFSKLAWFIPHDINISNVSLDNWNQYADTTSVKHVVLKPNSMNVTVNVPTSGLLVWTDSWNPGWRATVNGDPVTIQKVFDTIKAVTVPAGTSSVVFIYRPKYFFLGIFFLIAGLTYTGVNIYKIIEYK